MALQIAEDPASFIKVYALKRGFTLSCTRKLICKSFTTEAASSASLAQWDSKARRVISGREITRQQRETAFFSGSISREAGLTPSERKAEEKMAKEARARSLGAELAELPEGDFGAFCFDDNMSLRTLSKGKHVRPPPSGLSQKESYKAEAQSTHTFGAGGVPTFENLEGSDDESMGAEDGTKMDFDLDGMERDKNGNADMEMDDEEREKGEEEEVDSGAVSEEVDRSWDGDNLSGSGSEISRFSQVSNTSPINLDEERFTSYEGEGFGQPEGGADEQGGGG